MLFVNKTKKKKNKYPYYGYFFCSNFLNFRLNFWLRPYINNFNVTLKAVKLSSV